MYKWLKRYIEQFGKDFPLMDIIDHNEYEICRIIQECCESNTAYTPTDGRYAMAGVAKAGEAVI